jgi:putative phosphoesterase
MSASRVPSPPQLAVGAQPTRVVVLADTHLGDLQGRSRRRSRRAASPDDDIGPPGPLDRLPRAAHTYLAQADVILHAGDVVDASVLDALDAHAPTYAVLGNNDHTLVGRLPPTRLVELGGVTVAMVHDSGPSHGRAARLRRRFPSAAVVVYGHSHIPADVEGVDGQRLLNPGSPTQRRTQPCHTLAVLVLGGGAVLDHRIVELD